MSVLTRSTLTVYCRECKIAEEMKKKLLDESESVFDAVYDYEKFIEECRENCQMENKHESRNN